MVVISDEIGGIVEQHYNSPGLESGVVLLNNTTAGHCVRNVHAINVIEIEPILSGEMHLPVHWGVEVMKIMKCEQYLQRDC